jgi:hypothetical protein
MLFLPIRRLRVAVIASFIVGAMCVVPRLAAAQGSARVVEIKAIDKTMKTPGQSGFVDLADTTTEIKPRQTLSVKIVDNNPLLLTYSATVTKQETEQHKTAASFLQSFAGWVTALGYKPPSTSGGGLSSLNERTLTVEGVNFTAFQSRLKSLDARLGSLEAKIRDSIGNQATIDAMKSEVLGWNAARDESALATDYKNLATIAMKCARGELLQTNGAPMLCSAIVPLAPDAPSAPPAPPAPTPPPPATPPVAAPTNTPPVSPQTAQAGNPPPPPGATVGNPAPPPGASVANPPPGANSGAQNTPPNRGTIASYVTLVMSIQKEITDSANVVADFAADVAKLHTGVEVANVGYIATDDQKIEVKIVASDVYKAFLDDETKAVRDAAVKTITITVSPSSIATWSLGAAVVVPIISDPTFTAEKSGDKFVIHSKEGDSQPYQIAAMLSIEPTRLREQPFGLGLQIGVSPAKQNVALYVGPHIRLYAISIGGGLVLQRTTRLDDGQVVGQELGAEADMKLNTRLRPGGYVQVSVDIFKK